MLKKTTSFNRPVKSKSFAHWILVAGVLLFLCSCSSRKISRFDSDGQALEPSYRLKKDFMRIDLSNGEQYKMRDLQIWPDSTMWVDRKKKKHVVATQNIKSITRTHRYGGAGFTLGLIGGFASGFYLVTSSECDESVGEPCFNEPVFGFFGGLIFMLPGSFLGAITGSFFKTEETYTLTQTEQGLILEAYK